MSRTRRIVTAAAALALAVCLFHSQLAAAVVTRGDDALRGGDLAGATRFYERALALDSGSSVAADRLAFNLSMQHDRTHALSAIAIVGAALAHGSTDPVLFADRAFAETELGAWRAAERDFTRAGALTRDARYAHFAARMALHARDRKAAFAHARTALSYDPAFAPARALIRGGR